MSTNIDGIDRLLRKLDRLGVTAETALEQSIGKQANRVQASAKLLCPVNQGELRNSIKTMTQVSDGCVQGIVYTNKKYAPYIEFGTGPAGERSHTGISPAVTPSYSQSPWWIHESQIDQADAERYHFFKIETPDGIFYQTDGQPAQPFLYPALKNNEERVMDGIKEDLQNQIRNAIGGQS